jgi:hypothetical protein
LGKRFCKLAKFGQKDNKIEFGFWIIFILYFAFCVLRLLFQMSKSPVFISLGSDCSVSYQLRRLGLQTMSMPFDWLRIDKPEMIIDILGNKFAGFAKFDQYIVKVQSANFAIASQLVTTDTNTDTEERMVSLKRLVHFKYKFIAPHEFVNDEINIAEFESKYDRRIKRFDLLVKDSTIPKVFVRLGNKAEIDKKKIEKLELALHSYGCQNFKLLMINANEYDELIPRDAVFDWHRDYIPWHSIINI